MLKNDNGEAALEFYDKRAKWAEYVSTHPRVTDRAFRIGFWLARRMNGEDQCCWYAIPQIAKAIGKSPRTVASAIADLKAANVMLVIEEKGKPNTYFLHAPFF